MRRNDREIHERAELAAILQQADVCRIAFNGKRAPYIVALNFGFAWNDTLCLYFHCAQEGKKIEMMKRDNLVCFQVDIDHELVTADLPCSWGMKYKSVVGSGILEEVTGESGKRAGLNLIMQHYGYAGASGYDGKALAAVRILRLNAEELTGKKKE